MHIATTRTDDVTAKAKTKKAAPAPEAEAAPRGDWKPAARIQRLKEGKRVSIINMMSTPEYKAWVNGLVEHAIQRRHAISLTDLVDKALTLFAAESGYKPKPPTR